MKHLSFIGIPEKLQNNVKILSFSLLIVILFTLSSSNAADLNLTNSNDTLMTQGKLGLVYARNASTNYDGAFFVTDFDISKSYFGQNTIDFEKFTSIESSQYKNNFNSLLVNRYEINPYITNDYTKSTSLESNLISIEKNGNLFIPSIFLYNDISSNILDHGKLTSQSIGLLNNFKSIGIDFDDSKNGIHLKIDFVSVMLSISLVSIAIYFIWSGILALFPLKRIEMNNEKIGEYKLYIMIPSLNEKYVVENTIHQFFEDIAKDPRSFESYLVVIDDGSDDGTGEILEKISYHYDDLHIISRTFPNAQKGKGEALNAAFNYIKDREDKDLDKVIVGVIDADAYIKGQDYNKIVSTFNKDPELAMIQTSVGMNDTKGWLHRMQDIEFQSCICLISNLRNYLGNAAGGGNGQFFRLSSFKNKVNLWGNSLLEDFELSTRALLEGKKTCFLESVVAYQEPVGKIKDFIVQRTRWAQGGIECIPKYGKEIIKSPEIKKLAKFEMFFYMLLPFIAAIGVVGHLISLIYNIIIILIWQYPLSLDLIFLVVLSFLISFFFGALYGIRTKFGALKGLLIGATIPLYCIVMIPVAFRAIIRFILGERKWEKTEHIIEGVKLNISENTESKWSK